MQHFPITAIQSWERFYRANFLNCISGFKPASLIGTVNLKQQTNLAVFSNIVHLGADPALIGIINRPIEAAPHTISNIKATGQFTINHINPSMVQQAHQTSAKYPEGVSEFDATGLTPIFKNGFNAPYVQESHIQIGLNLVEIIPITHNHTFLIIGAIEEIYLNEAIVQKDGFIQLDEAGSIVSAGIDAYYSTTLLERLPYAKVQP
ncbi:MAG: flavin reductase family protein [Ferruginibacter sp.]